MVLSNVDYVMKHVISGLNLDGRFHKNVIKI